MIPVGPSEHPALEMMEELWANGLRASAIVEYLSENGLPPVKVTALAKYGQRNWTGKSKILVENKNLSEIKDILEEIQSEGLKVGKIGMVKRTGWGWEKQDGVSIQVPRDTVAQSFEILPSDAGRTYEKATLPDINIVMPKYVGAKDPSIGLAISIPDMQIGYYRDNRGQLVCTQDESAINVQNQIMAHLEATEGIDVVVWQGDNGDFPEFSSHRSSPGYNGNTQITIDRCGTVAATQRIITPEAELVWIEGNHEARLTNALVDRMPALVGLSRAGENAPVLSMQNLCRFDEAGVKYLDGYPNGEFWANDGLRFEHGQRYASAKGATAPKYFSEGVSTVFGHTHRQELVWDRQTHRGETRNIFAGSAGCSCKTSGAVPSAKTGISANGRQMTKAGVESWQQGMMVIYYERSGMLAEPHIITIDNGQATFRGIVFKSTVDADGNKL